MANEGDDAVRFVRASLSQCSTCRKVTFFAILDGVTTDNSFDLFSKPTVSQKRNDHNLMSDFRDEVPGYLNNRLVGEALEHLTIS